MNERLRMKDTQTERSLLLLRTAVPRAPKIQKSGCHRGFLQVPQGLRAKSEHH